MKLAVALSAVTLAAGALVAPPVAAAPAAPSAPTALVKKSFMVYSKFTSRQVVAYGGADNVGDLTITQGVVTDTSGKNVGTLTAVIRVVAPSPKKDAELRDTQSSITLKDGTIFAQAVNEDPKGKPPVDLHIMPVTGGTGAYASARGTLLMRKIGDKYLMAYDFFVEKDMKSSTLSFDTVTSKTVTGDGSQGVGDVTMARAVGGDDSYISIATRAGTGIDSIDLQVFTADGSIFARAMSRSKGGAAKAQAYAVLGGTGIYSGYRGELTLDANAKAMRLRLAQPGGNAKPIAWFEDAGKGVTDLAVTGGTFLGVEGEMFQKADRKKKVGDYFATQIAYEEIDGVTPILTMLEQDFKTGTMIVSGITTTAGTDGAAVARPIIGGTGDYIGASGQVTSLEESADLWRKTGRFWR
ncbi:MAG: allene oxide cyclase barrel-like domain-containing protein [Actinomycetota bacterium]